MNKLLKKKKKIDKKVWLLRIKKKKKTQIFLGWKRAKANDSYPSEADVLIYSYGGWRK